MKRFLLSVIALSLVATAVATGRSENPGAVVGGCGECALQAELTWARSIDRLSSNNVNQRFAIKDDYMMLRSPR